MKKLQSLVLSFVLIAAAAAAASAAEVALTSIGQSSDAMMVRVVLKSLGVEADYDTVMQPDALTEQKALVAVVGGSSKGLGAAGINQEDELKRASALLKAARDKGVKVIVMHVGGEGRRGTLSDLFIEAAVPQADVLVIVDGANADGFFDRLAQPNNIPVKVAPNVNGTKAPLGETLTEFGVAVTKQ